MADLSECQGSRNSLAFYYYYYLACSKKLIVSQLKLWLNFPMYCEIKNLSLYLLSANWCSSSLLPVYSTSWLLQFLHCILYMVSVFISLAAGIFVCLKCCKGQALVWVLQWCQLVVMVDWLFLSCFWSLGVWSFSWVVLIVCLCYQTSFDKVVWIPLH